jgi:hypothetical protein
LHGIYGNRFASQWDGADIQNVKQVWAEELGGFSEMPEAIGYAFKNLDPKFPPSALEFKELCRRAPRKEVMALPHKLTPEEIERNRQRIAEIASGLGRAKSMANAGQ